MLVESFKYFDAEIFIWKLTEDLEELYLQIYKFLKKCELEDFEKIKSEQRKKEWLAVRILLKIATNRQNKFQVFYNDSKKPSLEGYYISISHSVDYVCVMVSKDKICGIDVQQITDKTLKLSHKFLSDSEIKKFGNNDVKIATLLWSLKETAFKIYSIGNLPFIEGINIVEINENSAEILLKNYINIKANYRFINDYCLTYAIADDKPLYFDRNN